MYLKLKLKVFIIILFLMFPSLAQIDYDRLTQEEKGVYLATYDSLKQLSEHLTSRFTDFAITHPDYYPYFPGFNQRVDHYLPAFAAQFITEKITPLAQDTQRAGQLVRAYSDYLLETLAHEITQANGYEPSITDQLRACSSEAAQVSEESRRIFEQVQGSFNGKKGQIAFNNWTIVALLYGDIQIQASGKNQPVFPDFYQALTTKLTASALQPAYKLRPSPVEDTEGEAAAASGPMGDIDEARQVLAAMIKEFSDMGIPKDEILANLPSHQCLLAEELLTENGAAAAAGSAQASAAAVFSSQPPRRLTQENLNFLNEITARMDAINQRHSQGADARTRSGYSVRNESVMDYGIDSPHAEINPALRTKLEKTLETIMAPSGIAQLQQEEAQRLFEEQFEKAGEIFEQSQKKLLLKRNETLMKITSNPIYHSLQQAAKRVLVYCDYLHKKGKTDKANILFFSLCNMLEEHFQIEESTGNIIKQCGIGAKGRTFVLNQALLASLKDS
ncbi:MAG: hypothetical protein C0582_02915 [Alphaproteobacteria bacterium]|nr:MAG: hypothetical protein C0582_02915 [Alphaproteobacteria bacterium]